MGSVADTGTHLSLSPSDVKRLRRTEASRTMHSRAVLDSGGCDEL